VRQTKLAGVGWRRPAWIHRFPGGLCILFTLALAGAFAATGQNVPRDMMVREVHNALVALPFYTVFDDLNARVEGDSVLLSGQVTRPELKTDAERSVLKVPGVARVINQIEVLPISASDEKLRLAEYLAVYGDPSLVEYQHLAAPPIHIVVKNGAVSLEGAVTSESDKTEAFEVASGVPGVASLTNQLRVEP